MTAQAISSQHRATHSIPGWSAEDVHTLSVNTAQLTPVMRLLRPRKLTILLTLLFTTALAPRALAQFCGPNISLAADEWSMVGVPCVPGANNTVDDIFGPSFTGDYAVTWIVWKRVYDDAAECALGAAPEDCYVKLTATDTVSEGEAFWLYTTEAVTLDMSAIGASATAGPQYDFPATLSPDGNSRYYMFANGYDGTLLGTNVQFPVILFGFFNFVATMQQAVDNTVIAKEAHYWNGNTYGTEDMTTNAATFIPQEGAWLEFLTPPAWITNVNVRIPDPGP